MTAPRDPRWGDRVVLLVADDSCADLIRVPAGSTGHVVRGSAGRWFDVRVSRFRLSLNAWVPAEVRVRPWDIALLPEDP